MKTKIILLAILVFAAILRAPYLSSYPAGLNADEAALGYNAYSLLRTGKDEHSNPIPVNLESFADYKPALYTYLLVPLSAIHPASVFTIRLPSLLFSLLGIFTIYALANRLFPHCRFTVLGQELNIGHLASLILTINPWHFHFSRGAWETNAATTFIIVGVTLFTAWLKRHQFSSLLLSVSVFVLSVYTYQSARLIAPVLFIALCLAFSRALLREIKQALLALLVGVALLTPFIISLATTNSASRLTGVGLLADQGPTDRVNELRGQHEVWNSPLSKLFHNKPLSYSIQFFSNYFDHWFGNFLFVNGDEIQRNKIPETGQMHLLEFVTIVTGVIFLIRNPNNLSIIIWLWLFIAPLASALTFQTPHAVRAHNFVVPLVILVSVGTYYLISKWKHMLILLIAFYLFSTARLLHQYFVHYPKAYPSAWEFGFDQVAAYLKINSTKYDNVYITEKYDQPYILILHYLQFPPSKFQDHHVLSARDKFNFSTVRDFDKFHFTSTNWNAVRDIHSSLIVAAPEDIPDVGVNVVHTIYFPNGQPAFKIVSN